MDRKNTEKPNVLILFADDQTWNTIHAWGNDEIKTPNLDRLAAMGTSFKRAHVVGGNHGAICAFSRAMLLTGRPFWKIPKSFANPTTGECPFPTMPEVFRENGYKTYFTGKWHNQPPELVAGFDEGKNIFLGGMHFPKEGGHFRPKLYDDLDGVLNEKNKKQRNEFSSKLYADATIDFINKNEGQPFFIYTAFTSPHDPRTPPPPFDKMYDPEKIKLPVNFFPEHPFDMGIRDMRDEELLPYPRTEEAVKKEIALYFGMISEMDAQIGRILETLENKGILDKTIIVFAGDNGLAVGQHGLLGKQNLYDHSARVPLIIAGPNVPRNSNVNALSSIHDIFPTVADLCGIEKPESVTGLSLFPSFNKNEKVLRENILLAFTKTQRAIRTDDSWKLILTKYNERKHIQLFDLNNDPFEMNNLYNDKKFQKKYEELNNQLIAEIIKEGDVYYSPEIKVEYTQSGYPPSVKLTSPEKGMEIKYTLDGNDPTIFSKTANGSVDVIDKTILKAQTYFKGKPISPTIESEIGMPTKFAEFKLDIDPSGKYGGKGHLTLADGLRGSDDFNDNNWLGFHGDNCVIHLNLKEQKDISKISVGYLSNTGAWIFSPKKIMVLTTMNDEQFIPVKKWVNEKTDQTETPAHIGKIDLEVDVKNARRLHILVENMGVCPEWHGGSGEKAWLFLDEVWVE